MNSKLKVIAGAAAFALFIAAAIVAYNMLSGKSTLDSEILQSSAGTETGGGASVPDKIKAPDFTVLDGDGNSVKLSDMAGTPVVLNFWASWCPPCKSEMPEFDKVWKESGSDIAFMMVDLADGQRETIEMGAQYVKEQGFSFPVYFDTEQEAAIAYGITSIPTTFFIDSDGYIVTGAQGAINERTLLKGIDLIL